MKSSDFQSTTRKNYRNKKHNLWAAAREVFQTTSTDFSKSTLRWWTRWLWKTLDSNSVSCNAWLNSRCGNRMRKKVLSTQKPAMVNLRLNLRTSFLNLRSPTLTTNLLITAKWVILAHLVKKRSTPSSTTSKQMLRVCQALKMKLTQTMMSMMKNLSMAQTRTLPLVLTKVAHNLLRVCIFSGCS